MSTQPSGFNLGNLSRPGAQFAPPIPKPKFPASDYITNLFKPDDPIAIMMLRDGIAAHDFKTAREVASPKYLANLKRQNDEGFNIYVCMNPLHGNNNERKKTSVTEIRTLYTEIDENGLAALEKIRRSVLVPKPHFILESSPNKFHVIWKVDGIQPAEQEALNKALCHEFGGDPVATDRVRVLRLPGFINWKPEYNKPVVRIVENNYFAGAEYTRDDFKVQPPAEMPPPLAESKDTGFSKLFDVVEYRPLLRRINALEDARLHISRLECGETILCPLPQHEKHANYNFGPLANAFSVLHCFGCGFNGDMVKACYVLDGGEAKYKSMYACGRAICEEEGLNPDEFFPPKQIAPPAGEDGEPAKHDAPPEPTETVSSVVRPTLSETAYYGIVGDIIRKLEPEIETHPASVMLELMLSLGNAIGRGPYYMNGDTRHFTNEFMVKVGESSRARKGTGKDRVRAIMREVDPEWLRLRTMSGFGSGEAIVQEIRDPREQWFFNKETGGGSNKTTDPGIRDKRLCISVGEFQGILAVCNRPESLLSSVIRDGWDGQPLHNKVKNNPASCLEPMISIVADTTLADLSVSLSQADRNNGFANRFMWPYVYRTKLLPFGGEQLDWTAEAEQLRGVLDFAREVKRVFMDKQAKDRWERTVYPRLEREIPGLVGALASRASAHTVRLAMLYALFDKSDHICLEHLEAAEALWQYCEDSIQTIFGDLLSTHQQKILDFLKTRGKAATKTEIYRDCFQGHRKGNLIQGDLDMLRSRGKVMMTDDEVPRYRVTGC